MIMQDKLVTIGIPAFNSEKYISKTIDSILNQTYTNIEILISDNGSTDNTQSIVLDYVKKDHRIKYISNKTTISYSENCNKIISLSNGNYIGIYHSDDIYDRNIVEKEVQALTKFPDILGVFTLYEHIDENDKQINPVRYPILFNEEFFRVDFKKFVNILIEKGGSCFCCPTSMIKKDVYLKLNGYNDQLKHIEDQDMWLRILMSGEMLILKDKLIKYRIHSAQGSSIYKNSERNSIALPLSYLKSFLNKNNLYEEYTVKINIAEAKDSLSLALLAVKREAFNDYIYWVTESKKKFIFNFFNKYGFVQKTSYKKVVFFLLKMYIHNIR
jgi:glycosyltransferase involved in cell wall biosynthesis